MSRSNAGPGSITQWIATCHCSELVVQDADSPKELILLCTSCNKRISSGRVGSLTQWVFRSDLCQCENPSPVQSTELEVQSAVGTMMDDQTLSQEFGEAVEGLLIDEDVFPIDRYKPLGEIGRGASGIVYLSVDRMLRKHVAIKCLQTLTPKQLVAFQKEAQATCKLDHPNIIKIFDFGATENGAPYMVMEYAEGSSLSDYIESHGPLSEPVALSVLMQLASALSHAHARGIFHRDIKGSNVLVVKERSEEFGINPNHLDVRVIDLGIAALKEALLETNYRKGHTIAGTPAYMSADQFHGKPFDARSEVYSLGCLFFEMLTGRPPYVAQGTIEIIHLHANQPIPLLSEATTGDQFSALSEEIVQRCLAKEPDDRFQSMEELETFVVESDLPLSNPGQSVSQAALTPVVWPETPDRIMPLVTLLVVTIFVIFGGLAFSIWQSRDTASSTDSILRSADTPIISETNPAMDKVLKGISLGESQEFQITTSEKGQLTVEGADKSSSLSKLKSDVGLKDVVLRNCTLNDALMTDLKDCKLSKLSINMCRLDDGALNVLSSMKTLKRMDIRKSPAFFGDGLKYISALPLSNICLETLDLSDNSLKLLSNISSLNDVIILDCTTFDEHGLTYFSELPIKNLQLLNVPISSEGLKEIQKFKSLAYLALKSANFSERTSETEDAKQVLGSLHEMQVPYDLASFTGLSRLDQLTTLSVDSDRMQDEHFKALNGFSALRHLILSGTKPISSNSLNYLVNQSNLRSLRIIGPLNRDALEKIASMRRLQELVLCDSKLSDEDLTALTSSNVEELWILGDITLSVSGLNTLGKMPRLANLRLPKVAFITPDDLKKFAKHKPNCHLIKHEL